MRVLLTRPWAQSQELGSALKAHGVEWLGESLLKIVPVPWDPRVLAGRQALLVTSSNVSRELLQASGIPRDVLVYAVGPATAAPLRAAGFSNVHAAEGTAVNLIAQVRRYADPQAGRLLHLSGFDIALDLAAGLTPAGFVVDRVIVYRACAVDHLNVRTASEIARGHVDAAVFLSARTAATFCGLVPAAGIASACARMTAVTISRKVEEALRSMRFSPVVIAAAPSMEGVIEAILGIGEEDARSATVLPARPT